ncbi:MAG: hypothetical protein JWM12_219, partial [Ilumatobacteraceae bacterium]|nr:hypothetical protein [Ilumatobacteraceae bacterium]
MTVVLCGRWAPGAPIGHDVRMTNQADGTDEVGPDPSGTDPAGDATSTSTSTTTSATSTSTSTSTRTSKGPDLTQHIARLDRDGYTIVEDAFDQVALNQLDNDVDRLEAVLKTKPGTNSFEGTSTTRVYNLLAHGMVWEQVPVHPVVLGLMHH